MSVPPDSPPPRYALAVLTNEWEWREDLCVDGFDEARVAAREVLERVVREESPELACVTLMDGDLRLGIWDWVMERPYWTPLY